MVCPVHVMLGGLLVLGGLVVDGGAVQRNVIAMRNQKAVAVCVFQHKIAASVLVPVPMRSWFLWELGAL